MVACTYLRDLLRSDTSHTMQLRVFSIHINILPLPHKRLAVPKHNGLDDSLQRSKATRVVPIFGDKKGKDSGPKTQIRKLCNCVSACSCTDLSDGRACAICASRFHQCSKSKSCQDADMLTPILPFFSTACLHIQFVQHKFDLLICLSLVIA